MAGSQYKVGRFVGTGD